MLGRAVEQLRRIDGRPALRSGGHPGRTRSGASRHPHLHQVQAALGSAARGRRCGRGILRRKPGLAARES